MYDNNTIIKAMKLLMWVSGMRIKATKGRVTSWWGFKIMKGADMSNEGCPSKSLHKCVVVSWGR